MEARTHPVTTAVQTQMRQGSTCGHTDTCTCGYTDTWYKGHCGLIKSWKSLRTPLRMEALFCPQATTTRLIHINMERAIHYTKTTETCTRNRPT